jgi:hypothetical protein
MNKEIITQFGNLITDIEDRDDLPLEDIGLLWKVYDILRRPDQIPVTGDHEYCDHCGVEVTKNTRCAVSCLPLNISSANRGESATLCRECLHDLGDRLDDKPDCDPNTGIPYGEIS